MQKMIVNLKCQGQAREETKQDINEAKPDDQEILDDNPETDNSLFFYKVAECYIMGYIPDETTEAPLSKQDTEQILSWIKERQLKRQEWCLIVLYNFKEIVDTNKQRCQKSFDRIKQTILKQGFSGPELVPAQQQKIGLKIHKVVTCDEVGTIADEMIEVFTGMKQLQLTAIQITKL